MNPLDYLPAGMKEKIIDDLLTRLATGAEDRGKSGAATRLRDWRSRKPFIEDVLEAIPGALLACSRSESALAPDFFLASGQSWQDPEVLTDIIRQLTRPRPDGPVVPLAVIQVLQRGSGLTADDARRVYLCILAELRNELFAHPELVEASKLLLQLAQTQATVKSLTSAGSDLAGGMQGALTPGPAATVSQPRIILPRPPIHVISVEPGGGLRAATMNLLTPDLRGAPPSDVQWIQAYGPQVGETLIDLRRELLDAVEKGDFARMASAANRLHHVGVEPMSSSIAYIRAEADRISADFASPALAGDLRSSAEDLYRESIESGSGLGVARGLRGLGRVSEIQGDLVEAFEFYRRAKHGALSDYYSGPQIGGDASHEVLRSTRHYVAGLASLMKSGGATEYRKDELFAAALESERLHRDVLRSFDASDNWLLIEWFMGQVLLSRGMAVSGHFSAARRLLLRSLDARCRMVRFGEAVGPVLRGNLRWWCSVAESACKGDRLFQGKVAGLEGALVSVNEGDVWIAIEDLLMEGGLILGRAGVSA